MNPTSTWSPSSHSFSIPTACKKGRSKNPEVSPGKDAIMSAKSPEKEKNPAPSEGKTVEEKTADEKMNEAEEKPTEKKVKEAEEKPTEEKVRLY